MINIKTIFVNHFASEEITDSRLKAFCADHIEKLTAWLTIHTDPEMSELLADVLTAYNAYFGAISDEAQKLNIQRSRTLAADNAWTALVDFIRQQEGTVRGLWGKDSTEYKLFYPHGIDEYVRSTRLNRDTLLDRYLSVATTYAAELPAGFVANYTTLKNDYATKYTAQQQQIGLVQDADSETDKTRVPLEVQLSINMLVIGSKNVGYPDHVSDFFTQSIIRRSSNSVPADQIIVKGKVTVADTTTPVVNARVFLTRVNQPLEPGIEAFTNSKGRYTITVKNLAPGESGMGHITIDVPGFNTFQWEFEGHAGHSYTINAALTQGMLKVA